MGLPQGEEVAKLGLQSEVKRTQFLNRLQGEIAKRGAEDMLRRGMTSLQNEHRVIERQGQRLLICGVPDTQAPSLSNHISSPEVAQQGSKVGDTKILLAHRPQSIFEAVKFGYAVQISGHTHGGQFFPWTYATDIAQPYTHGLYDVQGTQLYVSRGTGYWGPPMRIGAPSEMTLLKLMPA